MEHTDVYARKTPIHIKLKTKRQQSQVWWHTPIVPAPQNVEVYTIRPQEFKGSLYNIASLGLTQNKVNKSI